MSDINKSILKMNTLEELSKKDTPIHRLQPSVKLITTLLYLIAVISFGPYRVSNLIPFIIYPVIVMSLGEIPFLPLFQRLLITMPFALFAGLSNLYFDREILFYFQNTGITAGTISFFSILIKTVLTVMAVLLLVSTTSMNDLIKALIRFRIPSVIIIQIMLTYRYIGVLMEELSKMYNAYILRAPKEKGIKLKDMGSFLGQLIIRSFDRAERIYQAMKCRGFEGIFLLPVRDRITRKSWLYLTIITVLLIIMRFVNISKVIGNLFA